MNKNENLGRAKGRKDRIKEKSKREQKKRGYR